MFLENGSVLGAYRIIQKIGQGGMGIVYLAEDTQLSRFVAIKVLHDSLANDPELIRRFDTEATVLAKLNHPSIISVYNLLNYGKFHGIVMEYFQGGTLKEYMHSYPMLSQEQILRIFNQILDAIESAHSQQIIHRDIKPGNVLINSDHKIKVMDFGIAKILSATDRTSSSIRMGTVFYMSPEQIQADKYIDQRSDIYSLGITLFELLTGRLPFNVQDQSDFTIMKEIVNGEQVRRNVDASGLPPQLAQAILRAAHIDRNQRFQSIPEFRSALQSAPRTSLTVVSEPSGMQIQINGRIMPQTTNQTYYDLTPGNYSVSLSGFGLHSIQKSVTVIHGQSQTIQFTNADFQNRSSSIKPALIIAAVLLAIALIIIIAIVSSKGGEKEAWSNALSLDSKNSYENYLQAYPNDAHSGNARDSINSKQLFEKEERDWRDALSYNTRDAYQNYLNVYPNGRYRTEAINRISQLRRAENQSSSSHTSDDISQANQVVANYCSCVESGQLEYAVSMWVEQKRDQVRERIKDIVGNVFYYRPSNFFSNQVDADRIMVQCDIDYQYHGNERSNPARHTGIVYTLVNAYDGWKISSTQEIPNN